jgi:hypothetical protein
VPYLIAGLDDWGAARKLCTCQEVSLLPGVLRNNARIGRGFFGAAVLKLVIIAAVAVAVPVGPSVLAVVGQPQPTSRYGSNLSA